MKSITKLGILIIIIGILLFLYLGMQNNVEGYKNSGTQGILSICSIGDLDYASCNDVSYNDTITGKTEKAKVRIDPNYYIDDTGFLKLVPYGNKVNTSKTGYTPVSSSAIYSQASQLQTPSPNSDKNMYYDPVEKTFITRAPISSSSNTNPVSNKNYNSDNFDITYHADPVSQSNDDNTSAGPGRMWMLDANGKLTSVPYADISNSMVYYEPAEYPFGPSSHVPSYSETVYLSGVSNAKPLNYSNANLQGGFCANYANYPLELEKKCSALDKDVCASTGCCVLVGGSKCAAGNEKGPKLKSTYSDPRLMNKDYYYYQGKCYGNCKSDSYFGNSLGKIPPVKSSLFISKNLPDLPDIPAYKDSSIFEAGVKKLAEYSYHKDEKKITPSPAK